MNNKHITIINVRESELHFAEEALNDLITKGSRHGRILSHQAAYHHASDDIYHTFTVEYRGEYFDFDEFLLEKKELDSKS